MFFSWYTRFVITKRPKCWQYCQLILLKRCLCEAFPWNISEDFSIRTKNTFVLINSLIRNVDYDILVWSHFIQNFKTGRHSKITIFYGNDICLKRSVSSTTEMVYSFASHVSFHLPCLNFHVRWSQFADDSQLSFIAHSFTGIGRKHFVKCADLGKLWFGRSWCVEI